MNKKQLLALFLALGFTFNAVATEEKKPVAANTEEVANADEQNTAANEEEKTEEKTEEASE